MFGVIPQWIQDNTGEIRRDYRNFVIALGGERSLVIS